MRRRFITKTGTFSGNLMWPFLLVIVVAVAQNRTGWAWLWWLPLGAVVLVGLQVLINRYLLKRRDADVAAFAERHGFKLNQVRQSAFGRGLGAIDDLRGARDKKIKNLIEGPGWIYGDFSYNLYRKTKHGEYKAATVYYGFMMAGLPRALPNVFFDSIKARRRQFRFHFARDQRHSLEGDFDRHFVTYFPADYTIDSMSFISPDVMWALRAASDYDVEIVENCLFLYGPLYDPEAQVTDMAAKITAIKKELLDNITTYRDERLPYAEGRQRVAPLGASLKRSRFWAIVTTVFIILYILAQLAANLWLD